MMEGISLIMLYDISEHHDDGHAGMKRMSHEEGCAWPLQLLVFEGSFGKMTECSNSNGLFLGCVPVSCVHRDSTCFQGGPMPKSIRCHIIPRFFGRRNTVWHRCLVRD
jgi:hypothetical protein